MALSSGTLSVVVVGLPFLSFLSFFPLIVLYVDIVGCDVFWPCYIMAGLCTRVWLYEKEQLVFVHTHTKAIALM